MTTKLYELVTQSNTIAEMIIENGGELTPELEQLLTHVEMGLAEKVDGYAVVTERLRSEAAYWKDKAKTYDRVAKSCESARSRLLDAIKEAMLTMERTEAEGIDTRYKLSRTKPRPVINEDQLPASWLMEVVTVVPDKERIREALVGGEEIPGCELRAGHALRSYPNRRGGKDGTSKRNNKGSDSSAVGVSGD